MKVKLRMPATVRGEPRTVNSSVVVDAETGQAWVRSGVAVAYPDEAEDAPSMSWNRDSLATEAESRDLDSEGTKAELLARLEEG